MTAHARPITGELDRPWYVRLAVAIEPLTVVTAIPVGWALITDPTGGTTAGFALGLAALFWLHRTGQLRPW